MNHIATLALTAALTLATAAAGAAQQSGAHNTHATRTQTRHETAEGLQRQARITEAQARRTALRAVRNGRVKSHELEREHGRLIYSYDITVPGRGGIEEVTVDARTGRIVTHQHETPADERREARDEHAGERHHR
ncbi:MAG TPA: PepSY domain-containing protein [Longimicrobium sp.]|nr:PepSY domain-containing protein [Longimicrobium sp.]